MYLKKGDTIGIIAPAGRIEVAKTDHAKRILESFGFKVQLAPFVHNDFYKFSATDEERLSDINAMIHDDSIGAIVCARGGYGSIRILEMIEFNHLTRNPKLVIGLSDITAYHLALNNLNIPSLHALMPNSFPEASDKKNTGIQSLIDGLTGKLTEIKAGGNALNLEGIATGKITGGNLSLIYALQGTPFAIDPTDKILFIEEVSEFHYQIDRMIQSLRLAGVFKKIKGLIVGQFTDCEPDNFGFSIEDIILEALNGTDIPVCFNFPAGHIDQTQALPFGIEAVIKVKKENVMFNFKKIINDNKKRDRR